jgi:hypothetical protein
MTRVVWTSDEWTDFIASAYRILEARGHLPMPGSGRYGMIELFRESQRILPSPRQRTWTAVPLLDRVRLVTGVNEINELANKRILAHEPTVNLERPVEDKVEQLAEKGFKLFDDVPLDDSPTAPPPRVAREIPEAYNSSFSFEGLGKMLDQYISTKIESAISLALTRQEPLNAVPVKPIKGSVEAQLLEDMCGVLDEVKRLRELVDGNAQQAPMTVKGSTEPYITISPVIDNRPLILVTGAHSHQLAALKREYESKLKVQIFEEVCPARDISGAKVAYVFEKHQTKGEADKLRKKLGREKVTVVPGGLGAVKRHLDMHVLAGMKAAAEGLKTMLRQ